MRMYRPTWEVPAGEGYFHRLIHTPLTAEASVASRVVRAPTLW